MPRETQDTTTNKHGDEVHPGFGLISVHRTSAQPGAVLFDSDLRHNSYITVAISTASRKRDLNHDWIHPQQEIVEVAMSEAQWASFVSAMNVGVGVPCTITRTPDEVFVPQVPYQPRLAESMAEVRGAADEAMAKVTEAFETYKEHKTVGNLRSLEHTIANIPRNLEWTAETLTKHTENVVQRARADIEAMVVSKAHQLGIEAADLGTPLELTEGT